LGRRTDRLVRFAPLLLVLGTVAAAAAWPAHLGRVAARAAAPLPTAAPVKADYLGRDQTIAFLEGRNGRDAADPLVPRLLSAAYLQRYREHGDVGDLLRAEHAARMSLAAQPRRNVAGEAALAGALVALHRFREARAALAAARRSSPEDVSLRTMDAAVALELGEVERARRLLAPLAREPAADVVRARLLEETGSLAAARELLRRATAAADAIYDTPAERRAWLHFRSGELAFAAGDDVTALAEERRALVLYPDDAQAATALARLLLADGRSAEARDAAARAAALLPSPESLGYLADAEAALGDRDAAAAHRDEIVAIERIGNAQRLSDRLLAQYYADHGIRAAQAFAIAQREIRVRDDIYAEDTVAWTAAAAGNWEAARAASLRATRYGTEDARLEAHAATIAAHLGLADEARRRLARACLHRRQYCPAR
jgi:hypothetical protein